MSIFLSTPVVTSGGGVQQVNSGNAIYVDNSNPAQPIVNNNGVIAVSSNANAQNFNDIYIDTSNSSFPVFYKSSPWARFFSNAQQNAAGSLVSTNVLLTGAWDDSTSQIDYNPSTQGISISEGTYIFNYRLCINNSDLNNAFSPINFCMEIDGVIDPITNCGSYVGLYYQSVSLSFLVRNANTNNVNANLLWSVNNPALVKIENNYSNNFGTQYSVVLDVFQITATNFQQ